MIDSEMPEVRPTDVTAPDEVAISYRIKTLTLFSIEIRAHLLDATMSLVHDRSPALRLPPLADGSDGWLIKGIPPAARSALEAENPEYIAFARRLYKRYFADLSSDQQSFMSSMSSRTRAGLRRKMRRFQEAEGKEIDFRVYQTRAELEAFLPVAQGIAARTYQARLLRAGLPDTAGFRARTLAAAEAGNVRAFLLYLHGEPVSFLFLEVADARAVYSYLGYLPEFAPLSPGTVLHLLAIEWLLADPAIVLLDFTEGEGQHKETFSTFHKIGTDLFLLRRTARNRLLIGFTRWFDGCVEMGRTLLQEKPWRRRKIS